MFSGIIQEIGSIECFDKKNKILGIKSDFKEIRLGESICCSGICLTVTDVNKNLFTVQLVKETLSRTTAKHWKNNSIINLERALLPSTRMGGHFVQGHIDCTLEIENIKKIDKSAIFSFNLPSSYQKYIVEKGSICLDGISLTVASVSDNEFTVAVIPHTIELTNWNSSKAGDLVNLEVDIMSKYVESLMSNK